MIEKITPHLFVENLLDLSSDDLKHYQLLIIDVDNTLIAKKKTMSQKTIEWLKQRRNEQIKMVLVSNNHSTYISDLCKYLNLEYYPYSFKPTKRIYRKILSRYTVDLSKILCIGDQLFTDVLGANRMSLKSVYVKPLSDNDVVYTKMTRKIEKLFLKQMKGYKHD